MTNDLSSAFEQAAKDNLWGDPDSKSGPGSNLFETRIIRTEIPLLIEEYSVKRMLDAPCGDFYWMKEIKPSLSLCLDSYTGADIVAELIEKNNQKYGDEKFTFRVLDITADPLPRMDLILTRDCFLHLSFKNICAALRNYKKSSSVYLLVSTYTKPRKNVDVYKYFIDGRALNLQKFPFYFPKPVKLINEGCIQGNGEYADKSLALWRLKDINLFPLRAYVFAKAVKHWFFRVR